MAAAPRVLVLCDDPTLSAEVATALDESLGSTPETAESIPDARRLTTENEYDLLIADAASDPDGLPEFLEEATSQGMPTILLDRALEPQRLLGALRLGVIDVLEQPVDYYHLERIVTATLEARAASRREQTRQKRLRSLSSRVLRDRRELRQRIDLLCKDFVVAYRRLAEKVVSQDEAR